MPVPPGDAVRPAAAYERSRPGYPAAVAAHITRRGRIGPGRRVLDVAAGTGQLTRALVAAGAAVVAVEPHPALRRELARVLPAVPALAARAEALPLAPATVDAVTVAQAFHWFDAPAALAEARRVLRPGGELVIAWNVRDASQGWVRAFSAILVDAGVESPVHRFAGLDVAGLVAAAGGFGPVTRWRHCWECAFDPGRLRGWVDSLGLAGRLDAARRRQVEARVDALLRADPDLAGRDAFGFPLTTEVWRCRAA